MRKKMRKNEKKMEKKKMKKKNDSSIIDLTEGERNRYLSMIDPLELKVEDDGSNFSVGQRQLLCLARAIVRKSKILLLDEATSAVDVNTDALVQNTIRTVFINQTILTIAHRIDTILDSDKIMIMENGNIIEFDTPKILLDNHNSKFAEIVQTSFGVDLQNVLKSKNITLD